MTDLYLSSWTIPAARLGGENPLPPLRGYRNASSGVRVHAEGDAEIDYPDKGFESSPLPYRLQDDYNRVRTPRTFKTAVLENDLLRATFFLEYNGRLWSLIDKRTGTELLHANPVFQPANVAIRNAWITSGVEWNIGIFGHSVLTLSPLFAARIDGGARGPVLRFYEFERARQVVFQIDCWLAEGSPVLYVRPRIVNPHDHTLPMYWWSNLALGEEPGKRILAPADKALRHAYDGTMTGADLPMLDGIDITYPVNRLDACDGYFMIEKGQRPWVTALDAAGNGLIQSSTSRLLGRKMWNWGMGPGGRRWQEFLCGPTSSNTIEVQAGLAPTQAQYVPMHAHQTWEWLETYGPIHVDPKKVHSNDWHAAWRSVDAVLNELLPAARIESELKASVAMANLPPAEMLHEASGWGALECLRRARAGEPAIATAATPFPVSSITPEQLPWLNLLQQGYLPPRQVGQNPGTYMVQPQWRKLLEASVKIEPGNHWLAWLHLGLMRFRAGDNAGAKGAWERSIALEPSAWAYRNLASLFLIEKNRSPAADLLVKAAKLMPDLTPLMIECTRALLESQRPAELLEMLKLTTPEVLGNSRIRFMQAVAALQLGDLPTVAGFFEKDYDLSTVRENEVSLSDLWFDYHTARIAREEGVANDDALLDRVMKEYPPPSRFDFRLRPSRKKRNEPVLGGE